MFTKDSRTENFLSQMGVEYVFSNAVRFSGLVPDWRERNDARPVPIREKAVEEYAELMNLGSAAPAPILYRPKSGKLEVLDGVQRLAAAELAQSTSLAAYIVESDSADLVASIRVIANARLQGRSEPVEWTRRRAVEVLVCQRQMSCAEVARMGGWKAKELENIAEAIRWASELEALGAPSLPDSVIHKLREHTSTTEIRASRQPCVSFLSTIKAAKLSAGDAGQYIEEFFAPIAKGKRHNIYQKRLQGVAEDPEINVRVKGRRAGPIPKDVSLMKCLKSARTLVHEMTTDCSSLQYAEEMFMLINEITSGLRRLNPRVKQPAEELARVPADRYKSCTD